MQGRPTTTQYVQGGTTSTYQGKGSIRVSNVREGQSRVIGENKLPSRIIS